MQEHVEVCESYFKDVGVVILFEVVGEGVGVHKRLSALAQDIHCTLQELSLSEM